MQDIYTIEGTVITGDHIGERLGYPTANLDTQHDSTVKRGVYAGTVERLSTGETYKAGIVIGAQDTHDPQKVEAHLIDFVGNLYGEKLIFHVKKYLRAVQSYDDVAELKQDIQKDIGTIRTMKL